MIQEFSVLLVSPGRILGYCLYNGISAANNLHDDAFN